MCARHKPQSTAAAFPVAQIAYCSRLRRMAPFHSRSSHARCRMLRGLAAWPHAALVSGQGYRMRALHDARVFDGGWTNVNDGPVRLVERLNRTASEWQVFDEVDSTVALRRAYP